MSEIILWDKMKNAVMECHSIDEISRIRNQAEAYRYALKQAKESPDVIRKAEEIKLRAERRAGELLKETPKNKGQILRGSSLRPREESLTLEEMGVSKDQSSKWQKIANIPEEKFENFIEVQKELSTAGILRVAEREAMREVKKNINVEAPKGQYDVIVIDPPWDMVKINRDCRPNQYGFDYSTMTIDEIKEMSLPFYDSCHLFLWTTQKYLPASFEILENWGANYVCTFVWHKPGGFQVVGLPQYNCEFVLYARVGSPKFIDTKAFSTCFNAKRGKHSEKPEEFYELIKRVTSGRRLDMFARRNIEGFEGWGNELEK